MKGCNNCGEVKPDDAFSVDQTRADGLANVCLECNRERAKRWYKENRERKIRLTLEWNEAHRVPGTGDGETRPQTRGPRAQRQPRAELKRAEEIDTTPDDWQMIRFSAGEWLFVLGESQRLGIDKSDYVRNLVRDARRKARPCDP